MSFGIVSFVPYGTSEIVVKAYHNQWSMDWAEWWFYHKVLVKCSLHSATEVIFYLQKPKAEMTMSTIPKVEILAIISH